ncbi:sugar porter family MFS transporter [Nocardia terpenica]|uniref:MFS transporter n=1 Tax=Nocardia terpenica TaxID=455432 RepID=A0A164MMX2_9NOCA|nr:sugar porter family MFS transporter [Nocardia terpenica]KZM73504.1 MFS transporter [Nocardia terpenica]MBF6065706.1 sugar porter family MFS transporter [Nocardia terpenica]MBF6108256.1 sugar porter family MFS transporter [Nocardia terpenica]MBF6115821.1 sugar porter family MFS transporter [Nocardia terpenica]MBF6122951.1 sugar porter family MFS transporter [Nocardia terpenica]
MRFVDELRASSRLGVLVGAAAASVGVIYGYDLSNIAGALLFITDEFDLTTRQQELLTTVVVIGEILGAIGGGWLANRIGRKKSMVLVASTYAVFAVLGALSVSLPMLVVARLALGLTIGISVVVVPVFVAESAPVRVRGALLVAYQVATVIGIIIGYLAAYLLAGSHSWRWMLGLAAIPAVFTTVLLLRLPDTARWYVMKGRIEQARRVLRQVEPEADAEAELAEIQQSLREESGGALREMLRRPYLRATVFVVGLGFFIQITGINAIVYYSPRLFESMGFHGHFALLVLPALVQVAALLAVLAALVLVDRLGRRPILLSGIAMMIAANILLIAVFVTGSNFGGVLTVLGFVGVLLFTVGFTFGFGSLVWVYAGESFPARLRSMGSSAMLTSDLVANAIVAGLFLTMLQSLGGAGTFAVFGLLAVAGFAFVYRYAPETKGRRLEEIRHYWDNGARWPAPADEDVRS